jgi:hypothetical protein
MTLRCGRRFAGGLAALPAFRGVVWGTLAERDAGDENEDALGDACAGRKHTSINHGLDIIAKSPLA